MDTIQEYSLSGETDYHFFYETPHEKESDYIESYYLIEAILKHDDIKSISRLKYKFVNEAEANIYWDKLRKLYPTSIISLSENTKRAIRVTHL